MELLEINEQQVQMILDYTDNMFDATEGRMIGPTKAQNRKWAEDLLLRLRFAPMGDNHHNAKMCPYCSPAPKPAGGLDHDGDFTGTQV